MPTGDALQATLNRLRVKQKHFDELCGVTPETVSRWIHGQLPMPGWMHLALAGLEATPPRGAVRETGDE